MNRYDIVTLLIGIYAGVFFGEVSVIYECEKDGTVTISGAFWKGETKYTCHRPATQGAGAL